MLKKGGYTFFWGQTDPFSQWHPASFEYKGHTFVNCEQFMMFCKAKLFGDEEIALQIMQTTDPRIHKALGRKVKGFKADLWNSKAKSYVYIGNREKFTQNPDLLAVLLSTKDTTLVEASPYDKIWGIGLHANDPKASDPSKWQGTNWLGEVLTKLRDELIEAS